MELGGRILQVGKGVVESQGWRNMDVGTALLRYSRRTQCKEGSLLGGVWNLPLIAAASVQTVEASKRGIDGSRVKKGKLE